MLTRNPFTVVIPRLNEHLQTEKIGFTRCRCEHGLFIEVEVADFCEALLPGTVANSTPKRSWWIVGSWRMARASGRLKTANRSHPHSSDGGRRMGRVVAWPRGVVSRVLGEPPGAQYRAVPVHPVRGAMREPYICEGNAIREELFSEGAG